MNRPGHFASVVLALLVATGCAGGPDASPEAGGKADEPTAPNSPGSTFARFEFTYFGDGLNEDLVAEGWSINEDEEPFLQQDVEVTTLPARFTLMTAHDDLTVSFNELGTVTIDFNNGDNNTMAAMTLPVAEVAIDDETEPTRHLVVPVELSLAIHGNDNSQFSIDGEVTLRSEPFPQDTP